MTFTNDTDLPEFDLGITSTELFAIKAALTHSDNYYTRRQMILDDNHPKKATAMKEHRAVKSALRQVDELLNEIIGMSDV
jgi:hypothetical protein